MTGTAKRHRGGNNKSPFNQEDLEMSTIMKKTIKYIIAALVVAGVCVLFFSFIGVGVFLLPLVGGAFAANK